MSGQDQKLEQFKQFLKVDHLRSEFATHLRSSQKSLLSAKLNHLANLQDGDYLKMLPLWEKWKEGAGRSSAASIPSAPASVRLPGTTTSAPSSPTFIGPEQRLQRLSSWLYQEARKGRFARTDYNTLEIYVRNNYRGQIDDETLREAIQENFPDSQTYPSRSPSLKPIPTSQMRPAGTSSWSGGKSSWYDKYVYTQGKTGGEVRVEDRTVGEQTRYTLSREQSPPEKGVLGGSYKQSGFVGQQSPSMNVSYSSNQDPRSPAQIEYEKRLITDRNRRAKTLTDRDETKKRSYFADPGGVLLPFWISHTFPENERDPNSKRIRAGGKPLRDLPDSYVIKYLVNKEFRDPHLNAAIADYVASQGPAFAAKMTYAYEDRGGLSPADSDRYRSDYKPGSSSAWAKFDREERGFGVSDTHDGGEGQYGYVVRDADGNVMSDMRWGKAPNVSYRTRYKDTSTRKDVKYQETEPHQKLRRGTQRYPKTYDPEGWFSRDVAELNKMVFGYANAVQFDSITGRYIAQYKSVNEGRGDPRRMGEWSTVRDPASAGGNLRQTFTPKQGIDREMMEGGLMIEHRPMSMKFKGRFRAATNAIFGPGFYEEVFSRDQGKIPWNPEKTKTNPISGEDVMGDARSYRPKYMYLQRLLRGVRNEEWGRSTEYEDTIQSMQEVIWSERFNRDEKRLMGNREEMEPAYLVEQGGVAARGNHPDVRDETLRQGNDWVVDKNAGSIGRVMGDHSVQQPIQEDWVLSLDSIQKAGSHQELDHYVGLIEQTYGSIREVQPLLEAASQRRSLLSVASK